MVKLTRMIHSECPLQKVLYVQSCDLSFYSRTQVNTLLYGRSLVIFIWSQGSVKIIFCLSEHEVEQLFMIGRIYLNIKIDIELNFLIDCYYRPSQTRSWIRQIVWNILISLLFATISDFVFIELMLKLNLYTSRLIVEEQNDWYEKLIHEVLQPQKRSSY